MPAAAVGHVRDAPSLLITLLTKRVSSRACACERSYFAHNASHGREATLQLHVYVCLAILETCTDELMELDESEVLWYLRHLPSLDMSQVITHALNIKDDVAMAGYRDEDCLGAKTLWREPVVR